MRRTKSIGLSEQGNRLAYAARLRRCSLACCLGKCQQRAPIRIPSRSQPILRLSLASPPCGALRMVAGVFCWVFSVHRRRHERGRASDRPSINGRLLQECLIPSEHNGVSARNDLPEPQFSFPNDEAALKLLYRALRNAAKKWTMPIQNWNAAMNRFSILWPDRMPAGGGCENPGQTCTAELRTEL
jgi:hypothetical protein